MRDILLVQLHRSDDRRPASGRSFPWQFRATTIFLPVPMRTGGIAGRKGTTVTEADRDDAFDPSEIRAAERLLEQALSAPDPTAWVYAYTEDAVFDGGSDAVQGRAALLEMATAMNPLSEVSIRALRTEGSGDVASVWCEASWVSGPPESRSRTEMRGIIVWRREPDGHWRVAMERIG